ncbi:MAG: hypothetical protein ACR2MP_11240 [Streptosporangiaceae bacterium]
MQRAGLEGWARSPPPGGPARPSRGVARARGVRHVILVAPSQPRWRRFVEGNPVRELVRKLGPGTPVEAVIVIGAP